MALAERMMNARYGNDLVDHYTYVIAGDGCLMEGISHEAIDLAGHLKLGKLIVLWDDNHISIDGATSLSTSTDQIARFEAAGWNTVRVNGQTRRRSGRHRQGPRAQRQALADRLQHHHRLWRAEPRRHLQGPWRRRSAPRKSPAPARSSTGRTRPSSCRRRC